MRLYIDSREPKRWRNMVEKLAKKEGFECHTIALTYGDYLTDHAVVERKSIIDLMTSMFDKRFEQQSEGLSARMNEEGKLGFLLVHGSIDEAYQVKKDFGGPDPMVIFGAASSLVVRNNLQLIWIESDHHAVVTMVKILRKIEEGKWSKPRVRNVPTLIARMLGVTEGELKGLMKTFGSLTNIGLATDKDLQKVFGIGPRKAREIRRVMNSEFI